MSRSITPEEGRLTDRLSRGEAVPGGPGACSACHHAKVWHNPRARYGRCEAAGCGCPKWLDGES